MISELIKNMYASQRLNNKVVSIIVATLVVLFFAGSLHSYADDSRTVEHKIKAAYLYNFLKFVKWPPSNGFSGQPQITICLLGKDHLDPFLEPMTHLKAQGRRIKIVKISDLSQASGCQLLFVGDSVTHNLQQIMADAKGANYLTVSDAKDFANMGGMIGFVTKGGKIKLEINTKAVKLANLQISAKLLEIATIVE